MIANKHSSALSQSGRWSLLGHPPHALPSTLSPRTLLTSAEGPRLETPRFKRTRLPHDPTGPLGQLQLRTLLLPLGLQAAAIPPRCQSWCQCISFSLDIDSCSSYSLY
ncbi:hypothetical protein Mapa_017246 [Marchantia paleacea]|nr:hypothetical protein Mapa_017246 [Marchantia paleacea]